MSNNSNSIIDFINKSIDKKILALNTMHVATITKINDKKTCDVSIDTQDIELFGIPFIMLNGGGSYLQFPISKGDKCLVLFNKDNTVYWSNKESAGSSDFDINNGFALVGVFQD
jgi:hypothetical protein